MIQIEIPYNKEYFTTYIFYFLRIGFMPKIFCKGTDLEEINPNAKFKIKISFK